MSAEERGGWLGAPGGGEGGHRACNLGEILASGFRVTKVTSGQLRRTGVLQSEQLSVSEKTQFIQSCLFTSAVGGGGYVLTLRGEQKPEKSWSRVLLLQCWF